MCAGLHLHEHAACVWRSVRAGQSLYQQGEALSSIFAVRSGTFKSTLTLAEGSARICAFPMVGDVLALEGLGRATYATTMTALDDAHVCAIARTSCVQSTGHDADMHGRLGRLMCDEIVRAQKVLVLMGASRAQDRMGVFLMDISRRYLAQGYSGRDFTLRMTRSDIGSFLGMALETVSRCLTGMQAQGVIEITNRRIQIINLETFSKRYGAWL
jgi:CRP/FNR family transcriptional regulator